MIRAVNGSEPWRQINSLMKNKIWTLVNKSHGMKLVGCRWIYKRKEGIPGVEQVRYEARLVAKGFTQKEGIDNTEIFSPVVKQTSIRLIIALVVEFDLELEQMDVTTSFLHGELEAVIYMKQPEGFEVENDEYVLKKSLYGMKHAPRH